MSQPIRDDELAFWQLVLRFCTVQPHPFTGSTPRDVINSALLMIAPKRAWYLLEKWANQGVYSYGTTVDMGWIESCCPACGWFGFPKRHGGADRHAPGCDRQGLRAV